MLETERNHDTAAYIEAGEKALAMLPGTVRYWESKRGTIKSIPPGVPPRDNLPYAYMTLQRWNDALRVVRAAAAAGTLTPSELKQREHDIMLHWQAVDWVMGYSKAHPGVLQADLKRIRTDMDPGLIQWAAYTASSHLDRVKSGRTYALYLKSTGSTSQERNA
jgi:hypothetical protein